MSAAKGPTPAPAQRPARKPTRPESTLAERRADALAFYKREHEARHGEAAQRDLEAFAAQQASKLAAREAKAAEVTARAERTEAEAKARDGRERTLKERNKATAERLREQAGALEADGESAAG